MNTGNNSAAKTVVALGHAAGKEFLKRAAVLHSDVAAYGDLSPRRMPAKPHARTSFADPDPPLLMEERVLLAEDGQILGGSISTWNWPFARSLLDLLNAPPGTRIFSDGRPDPGDGPVRQRLVSRDERIHAGARPVRRRDAAPGSCRAAVADGSAGIVRSRVVRRDPRTAAAAGADAGSGRERTCAGHTEAPTWATPSEKVPIRVPPASKTNAEAEALFRRALAVDPSFAEARVRLARLLQVRGRHQESAAELSTVLDGKPAGVVAFYAHLFAGRAAQSLGRGSDAAAHFAAASALFPDAQSALLAISHHALLQADVPGTIAPVARLGAQSAAFDADPWWQYDRAAGRDADVLLREMWAKVPR